MATTKLNKRPTTLLALTGAAALFLTACATGGDGAGNDATTDVTAEESGTTADAEFPRTVTVGDTDVEVPAEPQRIAVVSPDAASLVTELVPVDRIAMITDLGPDTPDGPAVVPGSASVDPEQILSVDPDLVLVTARHGQEQDAGDLLRDTGVPTAEFSSAQWSGIDDIVANLETIAQLTGTEQKAAEISDGIGESRASVTDAIAESSDGQDQPRVLTLMARGGNRMIMAPSTMLNGLVREAGGVTVVDESGTHGSAPADPETIAELNPDIILVEDFRGQGRQDFGELLSNPALADVPAIRDERVGYLPMDTTGVSAGSRIGEGLEEVAVAIGTMTP